MQVLLVEIQKSNTSITNSGALAPLGSTQQGNQPLKHVLVSKTEKAQREGFLLELHEPVLDFRISCGRPLAKTVEIASLALAAH